MEQLKYVITSVDRNRKSGGSKAKKDVSYFLSKNLGFHNYDLRVDKSNKPYMIYYMNTKFRSFMKAKKPDIVLFQYPNESLYVIKKIIKMYRKYCPNGKLIFLIHDIMGIQVIQDRKVLKAEIDLFNMTDGIIVHNNKMKDFLYNEGVSVPFSLLNLFDYQNITSVDNKNLVNEISFAGNLAKSTFLKKADIKSKINLYGFHPYDNYPQNITYRGAYSPERIGGELRGKFGLVWDGDSIDTCSGSVGRYLRINNPHKASLFISSELPIITWNQAALAEIINKYQIGFTVSNLHEIDKRLSDLNDKDYQVMKENVKKLAKKLRNGDFITEAVDQLI